MKNSAKNITIIGSIFIIVFIPFFSVSFTYQASDVAFVATQTSFKDKGYSESTYNAFLDYSTTTDNSFDSYVPSQADLESNGSPFDYLIRTAFESGAKIVGGSGFNLAFSAERVLGYEGDPTQYGGDGGYPLVNSDGTSLNYSDSYFILGDDSSLSTMYSNAISISFMSNESGFMAGLAAGLYSFALQMDDTKAGYQGQLNPNGSMSTAAGDGENLVGTWGGAAYDTVVTYMSGYEQGVNFFNYAILGYNLDGSYVRATPGYQKSLRLAEDINNSGQARIDKVYVVGSDGHNLYTPDYDKPAHNDQNYSGKDDWTSTANDIWFNGLFDYGIYPGGISANNKTSSMIDANTSVIFPVAGGQTTNALNLAKNSKQTKIIGVDTDLGYAFSSPKDIEHILGSTTKNLEISIAYSILYAESLLYNDPTLMDIQLQSENGYISGSEKIADGNEFVDSWQVKSTDIVGTQFVGSYENGGTSWITNTPPSNNTLLTIDEAYEVLLSTAIEFNPSLASNSKVPKVFNSTTGQYSFIDFAFDYNDGTLDSKTKPNSIEKLSDTFAVYLTTYFTSAPTHVNNNLPWIPDWDIY